MGFAGNHPLQHADSGRRHIGWRDTRAQQCPQDSSASLNTVTRTPWETA